ncbi:ornithine cyclodeaminase family protein [Streptomyces sp. NPDC079020]|uniref:ornithine cyclodeaminase family protein n=1 Tax=Streptomyces sp. NPDC079020 TaxID=3365722 RepID=UPI0037D24DE2
MTLLLGAAELHRLLDVPTCLATLREALVSVARQEDGERAGYAAQRVQHDLPAPGRIAAVFPGLLPGVPAYTVKVNAKYPASVPAITGVICLHDLRNGQLLALVDSGTVTAWRTGLSAALGTAELAPPKAGPARTVGVVGAGEQARLTLRGLHHLTGFDRLVIHDERPEAAARLAEEWTARGIDCLIVDSAAHACMASQITVTATWSRTPLLDRVDVPQGSHLTSLGNDEPGKRELSTDLLHNSRLFVDDIALATTGGVLHASDIDPHDVGTLGDVLAGTHPGRHSARETTVYAPVGLPFLDLVLAWHAYGTAKASAVGTHFDFGSPQRQPPATPNPDRKEEA